MTRYRFSLGLLPLLVAAIPAGAQTQNAVPARDLAQSRPPALRPAVEGPNGGVSTGHPLTTAAAFLLKGGRA